MSSAACCILSPHEQRVVEEQQGIQSCSGRERVFAILNSFKGTRPTIDVERAALFTASMRQSEGEHQTCSEHETSPGRGTVRRKQELHAKSEQSALGQQAPRAIGLLLVAEETQRLP